MPRGSGRARPLAAYPVAFGGIAASEGGVLYRKDLPWTPASTRNRWYAYIAARLAAGDERARGPWRVAVTEHAVEIRRALPPVEPTAPVEVLKRVLDKPRGHR